ncbi:tetratricopeptide repeat protein [bacterium]|nr:tetratricopeptide repeat protein [bacterium]
MNNFKKITLTILILIFIAPIIYSLNLSNIYKQRLSIEKDKPVLSNAAAKFFFIKGEIDTAEKILKSNLGIHPDDIDSLFLMAAISAKQRKYKRAKVMLHLLLKKDALNNGYLDLLIYVLDNMGNKKLLNKYKQLLARKTGEKVDKIKKKNLNSIVRIASATSLLKNIQMNKLKKMKKDKESMFFKKSKVPVEKQDELAQKLADETQELLKDNGFTGRDFDKSYKNMKELLTKAPDSKLAQLVHWKIHYFYFGLTDNGNTDWIQLQAALESYLLKYPDDEVHRMEAYDKLAMASNKLEDWNTLLYYTELYLEKDPVHYPILYSKATALLKLGQIEDSVEIMENIIKDSPNSVQSFLAREDLEELGY